MRKKSKQELSRLAGSGGSVLRIGISCQLLVLSWADSLGVGLPKARTDPVKEQRVRGIPKTNNQQLTTNYLPAMETVGIETAQNVVLHQEVASLGDRMVAYLIDSLVKIAWFLFLGVIAFGAMSVIDNSSGLLIVLVILALIPYLFYHLVSELLMDGQSIGKRARKIRVARVDGLQPTLGQYVLRWVLRPIDGFYYFGLVVILINGKGQRLGDLAAGTTVISLKTRLRAEDTLMTAVPPAHQVRFPEVVRLNDAQAALIKEVLNNVKVGNRAELLREMAEKVSLVLGVTGAGMGAEEFLQAVLQDYVYITGQPGRSSASQ